TPVGMTHSKLISVNAPMKILRASPGAHDGRGRSILSTLKEKRRRQQSDWQPATKPGRWLRAALNKCRAGRGEPLDANGIAGS
ncbi:MAG: hypothetical protein ACRED1_03140, partial [Limisphaerales bacterium]